MGAHPCSMPDCDRPHYRSGWCERHWTRWRRHGDPLGGGTSWGAPMRWLIEVALPYDGDECLPWPFGRGGDGYGKLRIDGVMQNAHREVCRRRHGEPPTPDHEAAHSCGRGHEGCVNGSHLRWATFAENEADKVAHGTSNRGERCGSARLTTADVLAIRADARRQRDVAADYGVAQSMISRIKTGVRWGWLA